MKNTLLPVLSRLAGLLIAAESVGESIEFPALSSHDNYLLGYYLSRAPTTTPWTPCWSPDGKWIAFSMYGSIWKVNVSTDEAYELTHDGYLDSTPTWSPDGNWIVYTAEDRWQSIQLEILDLATGETRPLTQDAQVYNDPAFSPDGKWLAYVTSNPNRYLNVVGRPFRDGAWSGPAVGISSDHISVALTNCIRIYVGNAKIRNAQSAEYFLKWIAKLEA